MPHICNKCGRRMDYQDDHSTTSGCLTAYPITVGPTIWGSEEARKILRYDEAIRLLRKWLKSGQYPVTETKDFLAAEPKKGREHE